MADWSRRRARGDKVSRLPPSLEPTMPAKVNVVPQPAPTEIAEAPKPAPSEAAATDKPAAKGEAVAASADTTAGADTATDAKPDRKKVWKRLWGLFSGG